PAARDDEPATRRSASRGFADAAQRFAQRARADPIDLGAEAQGSSHRVQMRVDEPRNHRAAAQRNDARVGSRETAYLGRASYAENLAVANRKRLAQRRRGVDGDDLAV